MRASAQCFEEENGGSDHHEATAVLLLHARRRSRDAIYRMCYPEGKAVKIHICNGKKKVFCGLPFEYFSQGMKVQLRWGSPWSCSCRNCLMLYYTQNPLTKQRTHTYKGKPI